MRLTRVAILVYAVSNLAHAGLPPVTSTNSAITILPGQKIRCNTAGAAQFGCTSASDWSLFNAKQAPGSYLTALTSDVSASGPGSAAATVNSVGGSTASAVNLATILANAATSLNTANALMKRGASGEFAAGIGTFTGLSVATLPVQQMYVTKDNGNDANDCSMFKPCKTIQAGITAANAIAAYYKPVVIHVAPSFGGTGSSYNENITISQQGVSLLCDSWHPSARACQISGTLTINMTGTSGGANYVAASNEAYMAGFVVGVNNSSATITFSGSTFQRFILINSYIDQNGSGNAITMTNSGTNSLLKVIDSDINNSNATAPAVDLQAGKLWIYGTMSTVSNGNASGPSVSQSGATTSFIANIVQITGQYNLTHNTATATFNLSTIASGTNPCIVTPASPNTGYALIASFGCNSSNTNSITGTGVVVNGPGNARFGSSGDIVGTVTQASLGPGLPQGEIMLGPGAVTGTNVLLSIKGGHIKVAQTTAPTATVHANAGTGATCSLSNTSDAGGTLSLTTGTLATAVGTQCTITFNKAHGVAPPCVFSPANRNAASLVATKQINFPDSSTTAQVVDFGVAETVGTAYKWKFHCLETQ